jgi:DNA-binding transcriptional regulator YiaG
MMRTDEQEPDAIGIEDTSIWEDGEYAQDTTDFDRELWSLLSEAIFGTTDQRKVIATISAQWDKLIQKTSTLGGYLENVRDERDLSVKACADLADVPIALWQDWENDKSLPSDAQMKGIFAATSMGTRRQREFVFLRASDPVDKLTLFCGLVRNKVAATTSPVSVRHQIWGWLPTTLQSPLLRWGEAQCQKMPEYLSVFMQTLTNEKDQKAWAREVLAAYA